MLSAFAAWLAVVAIDAPASSAVFAWSAAVSNAVTTDKRAFSLDVDAQGQVAMISRVPLDGAASNIKVAKFAADGTPLWTREINGSGNGWDSGRALRFLADGSLAVVGFGRMTGDLTGYITARLDAAGNVLWVRELTSASGYAAADAIEIGNNSSIVVSGVGDGGSGMRDGILTAKYDVDGNLLWQRTYAPQDTNISLAMGLVVDAAGNVTVCGDPDSTAFVPSSTLIASYDSVGSNRWASVVQENVGSYASALTLSASDQPVLMRILSDTQASVRLSAFNSNGTRAWTTTATPPAGVSEFGFALATLSDGHFAVTGGSSDATGTDLLILNFGADGALLWRRSLAGPIPGSDYGWSAAAGRDGAVLVAATSSADSASEDARLLEYSAGGALNFSRSYDDGAREGGYDVVRDAEGSIILAGTRDSGASTYTQFLVKYRDDQYLGDGFE